MSTTYDDIQYSEADRPKSTGEIHPKGAAKAVCVDVIDLGEQPNMFKKGPDGQPLKQRRVRLVWETNKVRSNGHRFTISKSYALSLYSGANGGNAATLYTHLNSWLGESWDGRFTSSALVGRPAELFIVHEPMKQDKSKIVAKVNFINPDESGDSLQPSGTYKRYVAKEDASAEEEIGF